MGLDSCESAFLYRSVPAILDFLEADQAPLMLAIQYLIQQEGHMWRQIWGAGQADGNYIYSSVKRGQLFLLLYKASHPVKAFQEARRIVMDQVTGKEAWEYTLLESAKRSLVFELTEKGKSVGQSATRRRQLLYSLTRKKLKLQPLSALQDPLQASWQPSLQRQVSLQASLIASLQASLEASLQNLQQLSLQAFLERSLQASMHASLQASLRASIQSSLQDPMQEGTGDTTSNSIVSGWI